MELKEKPNSIMMALMETRIGLDTGVSLLP